MDLSGHAREMSAHDFTTFKYAEREAVMIRRYKSKEIKIDRLNGKDQWDDWFASEDSENEGATSYVLICSRAPEVFGAPAPVSYLPFTAGTWQKLAKLLHLHRNITRTIARRVAYFSSIRRLPQDDESKLEITYTARTSAALPDDIALSSAYIPANNTSFAVFYGCNERQTRDIITSLRSAPNVVDHPLLYTGILTELERKRLVNLAEDLVDKFTVNSDTLENQSWSLNTLKMQESLAICVRSRSLMDQIRSIKRQLARVLDELKLIEQEEWISAQALEMGMLVKQKVVDALDELDDKIDECNMMAENLSLAMQTVWSQKAREDSVVNTQLARANTTIAMESRIENSQMRSIAVLGMIYLPLSCVGSIFSTTIFNWRPSEGEPVISNYIWILLVISAGLTGLTLLAWHLTSKREKLKQDKRGKSFEIELEKIP
ncbi:hypothetical protein QBC47DRAFT_389479 [Echria macrotheca]|uniref:Uncharacterized protein n=1 Tax=Echria macrotheca TaxID=438768 RepID=A0AAJ0B5Q8_9PEZI|nr:hypothetical protein QBC47DRAFT_389479 [Echria macrotheca]